MADIRLDKITKRFGKIEAVKDFSLEIKDGEFMALVGPSGCGKSTILRLLAGLETSTCGDIYLGDRLINHLMPKERDIALVFQNYALYPHLSVYDNIAFPLKVKKLPRREVQERVNNVANILGLEDLLKRKPREISGGQRQRVALGRAIIREPRAFLMDEPLSNLDAKLRIEMRAQIKKLQKRLGVTTLYVTHDQVEAMTMGDRVAVMRNGLLQQVGSPREIYQRPKNKFVAECIGSPPMNFLEGVIREESSMCTLHLHNFTVPLPSEFCERVERWAGEEMLVGIRPSSLHEHNGVIDETGMQPLRAVVDEVEPLGGETVVHLIIGKSTLVALFTGDSMIGVGDDVHVFLDVSKIYLFDKRTEKRIF
ncbi:MAG: sn-glycerol-3-phosphate ABC transporter ATP-binding protein UgpC [Thermodesulfobacteriota bacterium]|nr:sn-glycerol-3-phosphate ABC transporter ATP-binding protein UgpC [Thermodesulfobacteriota bacterium]